MIFNVAEAGSSYPGFSQLCDEARGKFRDFIQRFEPLQIRDAVIAYIDVVEIPLTNGRIERLHDFFKFASDLPERPFGLMTAFSYRNVFDCPVDPGPLIVNVTPLATDAGVGRFHMDWQKISEDVNTLDLSVVKKRLACSHEYMRDCFKESLTEEAWRLFDPREQD